MFIVADLVSLTHYDDTKKMAHVSHIVRAKEYLKLSYGGPSQRKASGTNNLEYTVNSRIQSCKFYVLKRKCILVPPYSYFVN